MYNSLVLLYSNINTSKKERLSTVLEPLQSMIQLALLSFSPIGSKLSIYENLLSIQIYKWNQSLIRNYYNDKRDDLYYLFNVINRFNKFYINNIENDTQRKLFSLLNDLAYNGLSKLIQTYNYNTKNNINIINTLNMYRSMIKNPKLCQSYEHEKLSLTYNKDNNDNDQNNIIFKNIDDLFINIKNIYFDYHYEIIYNFLLMIQNDELNYIHYIEGINTTFIPINNLIINWINNNLSC